MRSTKRFIHVSLGLLLAIPAAVNAQSGETAPPPIQASVGEVTDHRTTSEFDSACTVELKFTGDAAMDAGSVRQVHLTEATDGVGRNLIVTDDDQETFSFLNLKRARGVLKAEVKLRSPSRNATTIKIVKGEVELFNPTEANGGLLTITNILAHPAEPVTNAVLAKYGIQLMYLTRKSYEARQKEVAAQQSAGDQADERKLDQAFSGMFGRMMANAKNSIQIYAQDPDQRIVNLKFADGQGRPLKSRENWSSDDFRSIGLNAPPPPDTQLIIQLATPESLKTYPFQVENIPLP